MESLQIQITDIQSDDAGYRDKNDIKKDYKRFYVSIYGYNDLGDKVVVHVTDFKPYFYVRIPQEWTKSKVERFFTKLFKSQLMRQASYKRNALPLNYDLKIYQYHELYGFHYDKEKNSIKKFQFAKLSFNAHADMKRASSEIKYYYGDQANRVASKGDLDKAYCKKYYDDYADWFDREKMNVTYKCDSNLYESGIHPVIRMIHETGIQPTGWIEIKKCKSGAPWSSAASDEDEESLFKDVDEYQCNYKSIGPYDCSDISEYKIASFDIECDSSHGDFPQTSKYFKKLATDIYDETRKMIEKSTGDDLDNLKATSRTKQLVEMINRAFNKDSVYDDPICKMYNPDINHCYTTNDKIPDTDNVTKIAKNIKKDEAWQSVIGPEKPKGKERDQSIKGIAYHLKQLKSSDGKPIEERGDPVIQIGTVIHKYGSNEPRKRHIAVIGPKDDMDANEICDPLDEHDIEVVRCKNEGELLMEWSKMIQREDPDFITGYNIFGFDFKYIYERAQICFPCKKTCNPKYGSHDCSCRMRKFLNMGLLKSNESESQWNHRNKICQYKTQKLTSSALGENHLSYILMDGRILFDIQKEVQKSHQLESYKLDNVAAHFMRGKLKSIQDFNIITDTKILKRGDYVSFRTHSNIGENLHKSGKKYKIESLHKKGMILCENPDIDLSQFHKVEWCLNKDDVSPQDIFDKHQDISSSGSKNRATVAKYCIQDCELCIDLLLLLDLIPTNLAMANVSFVPISYIFLRGQGVKINSLFSRQCNLLDTRMPDLRKMPLMRDYVKSLKTLHSLDEEALRDKLRNEDLERKPPYLDRSIETIDSWDTNELILEALKGIMIQDQEYGAPKEWELDEWITEAQDIYHGSKGMEGYEGAIVLDPVPGIYLDDPIAVMDYASLYPSSIIEKNISHETQIDDPAKYNLDKSHYNTIKYDNWVYRLKGKGDAVEKVINEKEPQKICHFVNDHFMRDVLKRDPNDHKKPPMGIVPMALDHLLKARSATKKRLKVEKDDMKRKVLDCEQLAYKVTANSIYGQLGARTSAIYKMELAACTTSIGRERIYDAKEGVIEWWKKEGYDDEPEVVYGDTDSIFVKFPRRKHSNEELLTGKEAVKHSIECGKLAGDYITQMIHTKQKHTKQELEYEKTFWPFILISKKRYTGDKYEFSVDELPKRTAMGIVLKRRDNAPIVKHVFGNVIEKIMIDKDFDGATQWLKDTLTKINTFDPYYFTITKSLRGYYKNPQQIAHKVLADRMAERDPGNKPKANDRIPYAYIKIDETPIVVKTKRKRIRQKIVKTGGVYKTGKKAGQAKTRKEWEYEDVVITKKPNILQGDRIEHIDYIRENDKPLDYSFYITNQIMKPVAQVLELHMDKGEVDALFESAIQSIKE